MVVSAVGTKLMFDLVYWATTRVVNDPAINTENIKYTWWDFYTSLPLAALSGDFGAIFVLFVVFLPIGVFLLAFVALTMATLWGRNLTPATSQ
jgi:hypothetical protein